MAFADQIFEELNAATARIARQESDTRLIAELRRENVTLSGELLAIVEFLAMAQRVASERKA